MLSLALVSAAYVAAQMLADIASLRIVWLWGMSIDGGTFVYPITFTLRDLVHKVAGIKTARALIIAAAVINVVMALLFWFVSVLPADSQIGPQSEFAAVLAPVWRIVWCDPFCGSGTVLVACDNNERIGLGIEKLPKYCAVILERMQDKGLSVSRID